MQHEALTRGGESDPEAPIAPADVLTVDGEGAAFGRTDLDRFDVRAGGSDVLGGQVVAGGMRNRDKAVVLDLYHFASVEVVDDDQTFGGGVCVGGVVIGIVADEHQGAHQPAA